MCLAQAVDEGRQVLAQVAAGAEEERHDVDARRAGGGDPLRRPGQVGRHQLEEGKLDRAVRIGLPDACGDGLERLGPARFTRAVRKQNQCVAHRYRTSQLNAASESSR